METGVSYFSSRTLGHVRADLQETVDHGCTYAVHHRVGASIYY